MFLLWVTMRIDYRSYRQPVVIWTALGLVVAALVAVLFGAPVNGTRRWFGIGGIGVQPSELAKLAPIMFTAAMLERRMDRIDDVSYALLPIGVVSAAWWASSCCEPDFGTAMTLCSSSAVMVFAAGLRYRYLVGAGARGRAGARTSS